MRARLLGVLAGAALVTACSPGLAVDAYPTERGTRVDCKALYADVPRQVLGEDSILVKDDTAVAWGAPPVILRCGVERPAVLDPEDPQDVPPCNYVDGVDWVSEETADGLLFTTIGRRFHVSVEVPDAYDPQADALADLASTIKKHDPSVTPCQ